MLVNTIRVYNFVSLFGGTLAAKVSDSIAALAKRLLSISKCVGT